MKRIAAWIICIFVLPFWGCTTDYGPYACLSESERLAVARAYVEESDFDFYTDYSAEILYAIDGVPEFILIEFEPTGYLICFSLQDRVFPIEYSQTDRSPYRKYGGTEKKYYFLEVRQLHLKERAWIVESEEKFFYLTWVGEKKSYGSCEQTRKDFPLKRTRTLLIELFGWK